MKKSLALFVGMLAAFVASGVNADTNWGTRAGSSANLSSAPATRTRQNINYEKYQTRMLTKTYQESDAGDLYYTQPQNRSALYKQYQGANSSSSRAVKSTTRTTRAETVVKKMKRKYFMANPFYQPLERVVGSVTDFSYNLNSYDFNMEIPNDLGGISLLGGKWDMSQFSIKQDFSYGITDTLALIAMARYDSADYKFEWDDGSPDDKMDDNGLNFYGIGAQWRFIDNTEWIGALSAHYQHQKDVSNNVLAELKAGYKVATSTVYGLARGWYVDLDGDSYGNGIVGRDVNGAKQAIYMPYKMNDSSAMYFEGGVGVFSVLNEDWTLNVEGIFGDYDWHNQASVRGAIGWQPNDWFALNLYAKTAFYDSADDKKLDVFYLSPDLGYNDWTKIGTAKIDEYSETSFGLQFMFQF